MEHLKLIAPDATQLIGNTPMVSMSCAVQVWQHDLLAVWDPKLTDHTQQSISYSSNMSSHAIPSPSSLTNVDRCTSTV